MERSNPDQVIHTRDIGMIAEDIVARHLKGLGYEIVDRNYYCKAGEIDLVALLSDEMVFVEVRSRQSEESLNPIFTISEKKIKSLKKAANMYLVKNSITKPFRFDFAIVTMKPEPVVEIVENAIFELPFK